MTPEEVFLEYVVKSIVSNPDAVVIQRRVDDMGVLLEVSVDASDMGKLIGREGTTAKSVRNLVRVVGMKHEARVNVKILEPEGSTFVPRPREERAIAGDDVIKDLRD